MSTKQSEETIDQYIEGIVRKDNPKTVKELIKLVQSKHLLPEQKILEHILQLQAHGRIVLTEVSTQQQLLLKTYIFSAKTYWYWATTGIALATTILVFAFPENAYPVAYIRYLFGSIFVLFLPGFSFIKALFPTKELDSIERTALSVGMSLALVPIVGLILNYTPWGIRLTPILLSLLTITIIFATSATIREYQTMIQTANKIER